MRRLAYIAAAATMLLALTASAQAGEARQAGQIGQSRNLLNLDGNKMRVTLTAVVANFTRYDRSFEAPDAGKRYYAVRFKVKNISSHRLDECNDNDVQLATRNGTNVNDDATVAASLSCYHLLPGRSIEGWTVQMVPKGAKIALVDFIPSSQNADSVGEWKL